MVQQTVVHELGHQLHRKLTQPTSGGKVGDPGLVGTRPCFLLTDQDEDGYATCKFNGSHRVRVHAVTAGGNSAVDINDLLYYDAAPGGSNSNINKDVTNGVLFGQAVEIVASGTHAEIVVDLRG